MLLLLFGALCTPMRLIPSHPPLMVSCCQGLPHPLYPSDKFCSDK